MSIGFNLTEKVKEAQFSVVITRADGTVEDLGVVAYYSSNPLKNISFKIKQFIRGLKWLQL